MLVVDAVHYDSLPAVGKAALEDQQVDADAGFRARWANQMMAVSLLLQGSRLIPSLCAFKLPLQAATSYRL